MNPVTCAALRAICLIVSVTVGASVLAGSALADAPNSVQAFIQPLRNCSISFIGNLVCDSSAGAAVPITAGSAQSNPRLGLGGYRLCWISAAGVTTPSGATCAAGNGALTTPTSNFRPTYPVTFSGTAYQGCGSILTPSANDLVFFVRDVGVCTFTITTPDAAGFTSMRTTFALDAQPATIPLLMGELAPVSDGPVRTGGTAPLQLVVCRYQVETLGNAKFGCAGVVLNWTVLKGQRSCKVVKNNRRNSEYLGSISVLFVRPGRCTVQGTYPAVPGLSDAYATPEYLFTIAGKRKRYGAR